MGTEDGNSWVKFVYKKGLYSWKWQYVFCLWQISRMWNKQVLCDLVMKWRLQLNRVLFSFLGWALSLLPASQASISFDSTHPCTSSAGLWCVATFLRPESSKLPDRIISTWACSCSSSSCPPCLSCTWSYPSLHLLIVAPSGSCLWNFIWV